MRWLADECVHASVVAELRNAGHDVVYAAEDLQQSADIDLADAAHRSERLLLTEDKDFGDIVFRSGRQVPGFVLLRIAPGNRRLKWPRLKETIAHFGERLLGRHVVVTESRFRSRPLK